MDDLTGTILAICIAAVLSLVARKKGFLTDSGIALSFASAAVIAFCGGFWWFIAHLLFPILGFAATFTKIKKKKDLGLQEGRSGERSYANIIGVGTVPVIISILYYAGGCTSQCLAVAFLSAVCVSLADTISSEIGVFDRNVWMITTLKRTEPGINGGVSRLGLLSSAAVSAVFSIAVWFITDCGPLLSALIIWVCGMAGNLLDSVVGAVWENKGKISKYGTNMVTVLAGAVIGFVLCRLFL